MPSSSQFFSRINVGVRAYVENVRAFSRNASLYLLSTIISSAAFGVFRLLFNFYVLSLGFDQALLGNLVATSSLTALIAAIPMGYLADILGRKVSLIGGTFITILAIAGMLIFPSATMFILMNVLLGLGQSIVGVTMGPFLMENSSDKERTYLFSFTSGISMAASSLGNWIGGILPTWFASFAGGNATSSNAYKLSLVSIAIAASLSIIPLFLMKIQKGTTSERSLFKPFSYFKEQPVLLGKLILPMLVTSIGAGLIMPFMNVFFRQVHGQTDNAIGTLFAFGSSGDGSWIADSAADGRKVWQNPVCCGHPASFYSLPGTTGFCTLVLGICQCVLHPGCFDEHEWTGLSNLCDGKSGKFSPCHGGQSGEHGQFLWVGFQSHH